VYVPLDAATAARAAIVLGTLMRFMSSPACHGRSSAIYVRRHFLNSLVVSFLANKDGAGEQA
jgi:hypothetical protein